jgi:alpha-glucosidase
MERGVNRSGWTLVLLLLGVAQAVAQPATDNARSLRSPNGRLTGEVGSYEGDLVYDLSCEGRAILNRSKLQLDCEVPFEGGWEVVAATVPAPRVDWSPIYGERSRYPDQSRDVVIQLRERGPLARRVQVEFRVYNEGLAFRWVLPKQAGVERWRIKRERSEFRFVAGSVAWPIYSTEQTFSPQPVPLDQVKSGAHLPLTVRLPWNGFAAVLEANAEDYSRMHLGKTPDGALVTSLLGPVETEGTLTSPWRAVLFGLNEGQLIENAFLVLNLNPTCAIEDPSWIVPGKTISDHGNVPLETAALKRVIDFAAATGYKYLQLDWGWYGTEVEWSPQQREGFRQFVPERFKNTAWEINTKADPATVARGYVPYGWTERWKNSFRDVDLDLPELIRYGREHGVGICLYVEAGRTLRGQDLDKLFALYEQWGLAGLKPGFVQYGTQENTRWIRRLVETAAKHKLWLCIHDAHVPDGMERTYPNLMVSEGGGGQEGNHPVHQDLMLPFTRCLAGAFDYTPNLYTKGRSHAHMLAFFVVYYGPTSITRGGYQAWHEAQGALKGGTEREILRRVPTTWDDTRVLAAEIGHKIVVARRSGQVWFIGAMTGDAAADVNLPLDFLAPDQDYRATVVADDPAAAADGTCPARLSTSTVRQGERLSLHLERAGGAAVILDPVSR